MASAAAAASLEPEWIGKGEGVGAQWRLVGHGKGHSGKILHRCHSTPNGRLLVTSGEDGTVRLWDPTTGRQLGDPLHHSANAGDVNCTAIYTEPALENGTGDGVAWILSGGKDKVLRVWKVPVTLTRNPIPGSPSGKGPVAVVGGMKAEPFSLVAERQFADVLTSVAWKGKSRIVATLTADTRVLDLVSAADAGAGGPAPQTLEERVTVAATGQLVVIDSNSGPTEEVLILSPTGKVQFVEATVMRQRFLDVLGENKMPNAAQLVATAGGRRLVAIAPSSQAADPDGTAGTACPTTVTVWDVEKVRQAMNAPKPGSRSGVPLMPIPTGLSTPKKSPSGAAETATSFSPPRQVGSPSSPRAKFEFLENAFDAAAAVAAVPVDLPSDDFVILTATGKSIAIWQAEQANMQPPSDGKCQTSTTRSLKRVGSLEVKKPDGVEIESLSVSKGGAFLTSVCKDSKSDNRILCFWVASTLAHSLQSGETAAAALPSIPSPVRPPAQVSAGSIPSAGESLPLATKTKLLEAFEVIPKGSDGNDLPLTELACNVVEEFCTLRFAARLIAPAQQRIEEIQTNPVSCTIPETPIVTKGLEAERRRTEIMVTMRSLEEQLKLCEVDYSLKPKELEPKLDARDIARAEAVRLWNLAKTQRDELTAHLEGKLPMLNVKPTIEDPNPRDIYARIEQKELSNLKECTERVVSLVDRFTASFKSDCATALGSTPKYQEEYNAAILLRDALVRSNSAHVQEEYEHQTAELKRQLEAYVRKADETLSEVRKTIDDLEQDMKRIIDITKDFPFGSDGTTPRALARNELVAVKTRFVDPIEEYRHKKNQINGDLQFYREKNPAKAADLARDMDLLDAELGKLTKHFNKAYDENVCKTRTAFPELEEYVHTEIDPFCGQGNFRMDLGLADFDMKPLYRDTVFIATPIAGVAAAKELDSVYIMKRYSDSPIFHLELATMRNAKSDGKHHENVVEACFSFSQNIGGVVYYYIGLPYYRCSSPDWFIARIKAGDKLAIVQAMQGMVKGLQCLHDNRVVHGDVKPANLLFDTETASGVAKWIDFNFSANQSATLKLRGLTTVMAVGFSEGFTSPEQRDNLILAPEGDVYALGKTFAALLFIAGCSPWETEERKAETWIGDDVEKLFGSEIHAQIVTMIKSMTRKEEAGRLSLMTDDRMGLSVHSRLEAIRKAL
jgi:serine/threonine protein kinase